MLLDVGNSAIKWATEKNGVLEASGRFYYRDTGFSLAAEQAWRDLPRPALLAVASVVGGDVESEISAWMDRVWGMSPCYIHASKQAGGVTNGYVEPEALGADRWAAIVAAYQGSAKPVCVIDCGTAITLDVVDADGIHQGGLIAPGLDMMRRSLVTGTSAIGSLVVEARSASPLLARNTTDGVNNGTMRMAGALIDRVIEEAAADYGRDLQAVITGGDAGRLQPLLRCSPRYDRDLVLKGIAILARDIAVPITPSPVGRGLG
jgi:type III pantothenate kinase